MVDEQLADCVLIRLGLGPKTVHGTLIEYGAWGGLYWWPVLLDFRNGSMPVEVFINVVCSSGVARTLVQEALESCSEC